METIKNFFNKIPSYWLVAISAWGSKIITSAVQIFSIRALLLYLGEDRYAVYIIAMSLSAWIALAECGVGISLQNYISECRAKQKSYDNYLLAALQIACVLLLFFLILILFLSAPVQNIIFRKFTYIAEVNNSHLVAVLGIVILASSIASIAYRVYYALHKGYISNILPALAAITSMILIVLVKRYATLQGSILLAILIFTVPQLTCALIPFIKIFKKTFKHIFHFDKNTIRTIAVRAGKFHGIAVLYAFSLQTDYLIMSQTLRSSDIVTYNIFMKVFAFLIFIYTSLLTASWPIFSELFITKQFIVIKQMLKKYLIYGTLLFITGTFAIYLFSKPIVHLLAPGIEIHPTFLLIMLFGTYILLKAWTDTFSTFIQSANILRIFWIFMPFQITTSVTLQYVLSKQYGIYGILSGFILSILLTSFWILPYKTIKIFKEYSQARENE